MNKKLLLLLVVVLLGMLNIGCQESVPPGYIGMIMTPNGLSGEILSPGSHMCYNRDQLYLIDASEEVVSEPLSILCADDLNFKFDLKIRSRLKNNNSKEILQLLKMKGSKLQQGKISFQELYTTYVKPLARSIARGVVSKYKTTEIRENRSSIQKQIQQQLVKSLEGTPMEVVMVVTSNFDYPDVITKAVEKKGMRQIEIDEQKAIQAMELVKANARLILAEKMRQVRTVEAEAESTYYRIIGGSLSDNYLRLRSLENDSTLYTRVGAGDKVIVTERGATPLIGIK